MKRIFSWIKNNKLASVLLAILLYFFIRNFLGIAPALLGRSLKQDTSYSVGSLSSPSLGISEGVSRSISPQIGIPPIGGNIPPSESQDRLVVQETNLSLLVEDVRSVTDSIIDYVSDQGGYMVSSSINQPEEAAFGTVVVRVPGDRLRESMDYFRSLSIKVSSENISGRDVTDEYEDIEAGLATLETTKSRFEEIMRQASEIDDILRVQRELISLQRKIDNLKGRQLYLEQTAKLAKVTIHLSTDEIALPYTPSETFRPNVVFKLAWRSLVRSLRKLATAFIWIAVYSIIWVPVLIVFLLIKRWKARSKPQEQ